MTQSSDLFRDARTKVDRAHEHITEFKALIEGFIVGKPWAVLVEPAPVGPQYVYKLRLGAELYPDRAKILAAEAFGNMRSALDLAIVAYAKLAGAPDLKQLKFPFASSAERWEVEAKKCGSLVLPVIQYLRTLRPYAGGDEWLYALSQIRNENEHRAMTPTLVTLLAIAISRPGQPQQLVHVPESGFSAGSEIELFTDSRSSVDYVLHLVIESRFQETGYFGAATPETVLRALWSKISGIVDMIEKIATASP